MFDLKIGFSIRGLIIFLAPMVINIVCLFYSPNISAETITSYKWIETVEQATRVLYALAMVFLVSRKPTNIKSIWLILAVVFFILYHIAWLRYFMGGMDPALLRKSLFLVPMPLGVFPVLYFIFAALWLHNGVAAIIMAVFGLAHNTISYRFLVK